MRLLLSEADVISSKGILETIISVLPQSPFTGVIITLQDEMAQTAISYLNWFIPIGDILGILTYWLSAITLYYIYSVVLRWIKVIN